MATTTLLIAGSDPEECLEYAGALRAVVDTVYTATTFAEARDALLSTKPDVLVTKVRLAEFNGIHLALWGRRRLPHLRCVIIGESDPALEVDARASGFFYIRFNDPQTVLQATSEAIAREHPRRRWRRKRLASNVVARIDEQAALLLEVGYGGFCVQTEAPLSAAPNMRMTLHIDALAIRAEATCRWVTPIESSGMYWCGASLADAEISAGSRWRALVDTLPSA